MFIVKMTKNIIENLVDDNIESIMGKYLFANKGFTVEFITGLKASATEERIFKNVMIFLKKCNKKLFSNNKALTNNLFSLEKFEIINCGKYHIFYNNSLILIDLKMENDEKKTISNRKSYKLILRVFGPGAEEIKKIINKIIYDEFIYYKKLKKKNLKKYFEYALVQNNKIVLRPSGKLYFNSIISKEKSEIFTCIEKWYNSKLLFSKHSICHKIGILLYGKPGTGKSSIIKAIATHFKCKTMFISSLEDIECAIDRIFDEKDVTSYTSFPYLIIFEDIDCIIGSRDSLDDNKKKMMDSYYSQLINLLDGITAPSNVIFIATTNYIDKLDPAFIRDGRFNLKIEMKYFDEPEVREMCKLYEVNYNDIKDKIETPICPATCQKILLEKLESDYNNLNH